MTDQGGPARSGGDVSRGGDAVASATPTRGPAGQAARRRRSATRRDRDAGRAARRAARRRIVLLSAAAAAMALGGALAAVLLPRDAALGVVIGGAGVVAGFALVAALVARPAPRPRLAPLERAASSRHEELLAAVRREGLATSSQVEAFLWLKEMLRLERPLGRTRDWAAAPDLLLELIELVDSRRPALVVELGSGVSSVVLARRLQQVGSGRLVSVEHDPAYAARTRASLAVHGLAGVAAVIDAPLGPVGTGSEQLRWYQVPDGAIDAPIDMLVVDGPPQRSGRLARYPALPVLRDRLAPGAVIVMDDSRRPSEQEAIRRWRVLVPGLEVRELDLVSGAAVLRMPG